MPNPTVSVVPSKSITPVVVTLGGRPGPAGTKGEKGDSGVKGDPGRAGGSEVIRPAKANLSGHRGALITADGKIDYASNADISHLGRCVGITTGAAMQGTPATVSNFIEITEPSWNWDVNQPVYLGADGYLTQIPPSAPAAKFSVVVGFPISITTLFVNVGIPIVLNQ